MKRKLVGHMFVIFLLLVMGCSNSPKISSEEQVKENLNKYITALETKDIETMLKLTDDLRFPNKKEQKKQYETIDDNIKDVEIKDLRQISGNEYLGTLGFTEGGKYKEISLPITKKSNNKWMIIVGKDVPNKE